MSSARSFLAFILALALVPLSRAQSAPSVAVAPNLTKVGAAINALAVDLWGQLATRDGNLAFSPASIAMGLAMTTAGARGATQQELLRFLHVDDPALLPVFGVLGRALTADATVKVTVANRLFGDKALPFEPPFLELLAKGFDSPLQSLDIRGDADKVRRHINEWIAEQTAQTIRDLLPPQSVTADTHVVLANAMHFVGTWSRPFTESMTRPQPFHLADDTTVMVPTMERTGYYWFAEIGGAEVLQLAYEGEQMDGVRQPGFAMLLVLPPKDAPTASWLGKVLPTLPSGDAAKHVQQLHLRLPRFRVAAREALRLRTIMQALGVKLAFDASRADLAGIADPADPKERIRIDDVCHKASVHVDEKGTEAAAAHLVGTALGKSGPPREVFFDRPFWFALRHEPTGAVLFAGKVMDPR